MSQVGRKCGGYRMEGRDVNNDMAEIKRMLQQLAVRIDRIEARRRGRKSSDGERNATTYHQRINRIETFNHKGDSSDGEICVGPFHRSAPLCESGEEGHSTFNYSGCKSTIFNFPFVETLFFEKAEKDNVVDFSKPPIYDDCPCEICCGNCGVKEDEDTNKDAIKDCCGNCGDEEDEEPNKKAIKAMKKDIDNNFVDFLRVNIFVIQIPKTIVNLVNEINDVKGSFGTTRLRLKRKTIGSRSSIYSKYLFIWNGRIQLQANLSKEDLKQWHILSRFSSINGLNSRTNSFQPGEFDAGAYGHHLMSYFVIFDILSLR